MITLKKLAEIKKRIVLKDNYIQVTNIKYPDILWISINSINKIQNYTLYDTIHCRINNIFQIDDINADDLLFFIEHRDLLQLGTHKN
jgi:hypothetical protein